jgi:hypothetical protein
MAAAGSIVETFQGHRSVKTLALAWTSSAGGAVSGIATAEKLSGELLRVAFIPGAAGVQPTDAYDVTLTDDDGFDVLGGKGANLSNATASSICPLVGDGTTTVRPFAIDGNLNLVVANAGAAKAGTVKLYIR